MAAKQAKPVAPAPGQDLPYDRCCISTGAEHQCWFPASFYPLSGKRGLGYCRLHEACKSGPGVEEIIEESIKWRDLRRAGKDVPLVYTLAAGRKVPGFPGAEQAERAHRAWLSQPPAPRPTRAQLMGYDDSAAGALAEPAAITEREPGED